MSDLEAPIWTFVALVPIALVAAGGVLAAVLRWRRHPRTSLLVCVSCALLLLLDVSIRMLQVFVFPTLYERAAGGTSGSWANVSAMLLTIAVSVNTAFAAVFAILLVTAFRDRRAPGTTA